MKEHLKTEDTTSKETFGEAPRKEFSGTRRRSPHLAAQQAEAGKEDAAVVARIRENIGVQPEARMALMTRMLEGQQSRLRLEREKLQKRLTHAEFDSEIGERSQFVIEQYDEKVDAVKKGLETLKRGEAPKALGSVEALAFARERAEDDLEKVGHSPEEQVKAQALMNRIASITEELEKLPTPIVEEATKRAAIERTMSAMLDEDEGKTLASEKAGLIQLDLEYLHGAEQPPRLQTTRALFSMKRDAEEKVERLRASSSHDPEIPRLQKRIQTIDSVFQHVNQLNEHIVPNAVRGMNELRLFSKEMSHSNDVLKGIDALNDGRQPEREFVETVMAMQNEAEHAHQDDRVVRLAAVLGMVLPETVQSVRKTFEEKQKREAIKAELDRFAA